MPWVGDILFYIFFSLQIHHVFYLLCQFVNYMEVIYLPIYHPSEQEKEDPKLYANNVRKLMATEVCTQFTLSTFISDQYKEWYLLISKMSYV